MKTIQPVRLSRRSVLRGSVGGASIMLGLPVLDAMLNPHGTALAAGQAFPVRMGVWFWGNGVRLSKWNPTATGANWQLSETLAPFANVKAKMTVVSGMNVKTPDIRAHHSGQAAILTGAPPVAQAPKNGAPFASTFRTASIDQMAAAVIGTQSKFRSLQVGVSNNANRGEGTNLQHISHNGPDNPNPSEYDALKVFNRLFSGSLPTSTPSAPAPADMSLALRKSVLDAVLDDMNALKAKVGSNDRKRLDQHAENVRAIELRLAVPTSGGSINLSACKKPAPPGAPNSVASHNQMMADLMVMALACDLTRVFTYQFSSGVDSTIYNEAGVNGPHHQLTHDEGGDQPNVQKICLFMMKQFAYFAERLASVQEGDKTLLDNCSILGTTDCAEGQPHSLTDYPMIVMGGGGGKLKTGLHYRSNGENATMVLLSVLKAAGAPLAELGAGNGKATTGLAAIEA